MESFTISHCSDHMRTTITLGVLPSRNEVCGDDCLIEAFEFHQEHTYSELAKSLGRFARSLDEGVESPEDLETILEPYISNAVLSNSVRYVVSAYRFFYEGERMCHYE